MRLLLEFEFGKKNDLRYRTNFGNFITKHIKKPHMLEHYFLMLM